jgi:hypothetical protein
MVGWFMSHFSPWFVPVRGVQGAASKHQRENTAHTVHAGRGALIFFRHTKINYE